VAPGAPRSPYEKIFIDGEACALEQALSDRSETVLICGHTLIPWQNVRLEFCLM
jgi:hypothetical protein